MSNQRFRVNTPTITHETIDGEAVIINLDSGNYYSLMEVGSFIWGLVEKGASASEVQNLVLQTYQGNATDIDRGVQELLPNCNRRTLLFPLTEREPLILSSLIRYCLPTIVTRNRRSVHPCCRSILTCRNCCCWILFTM